MTGKSKKKEPFDEFYVKTMDLTDIFVKEKYCRLQ